jgi:hypothetical protein
MNRRGGSALGGAEAASLCGAAAELNRLIADELESFGKKIQSNADGIDEAQIEVWKRNMLSLADSQAKFQHELEVSKSLLSSPEEFDDLVQRSFTDLNNADIKAAEKSVFNLIEAKCDKFDCDSSKLKDKLNVLFRVSTSGKKRAAADDIEVFEAEAREVDFKCKITMQIFREPFMNPGAGGCSHHVEKEALLGIFKGKQTVKCPQMGCTSIWNKQTCCLDEDFLFKMNRFLKRSQTQKSQRSITTDDDDIIE